MSKPDTTEPTWVAFEIPHPVSTHKRGRVWQMCSEQVATEPATETTLQDVQDLYPEADIVVSGMPDAVTHSLPYKPAQLCPRQIGGDQKTHIMSLPSLLQEQPFSLLAGGTMRCDAYLSLNKNWDGVIFLPGQPNQWVQASAEEIISFQSFSTEAIIENQWSASIPQIDGAQLTNALQDTLSRPETLASRLTELQSQYALKRISASQAYSRLWGVCLGAEFAAARPYWLGQNIAMITSNDHAAPYRMAFDSLAIPVTQVDETQMTLLGFMRAKQRA